MAAAEQSRSNHAPGRCLTRGRETPKWRKPRSDEPPRETAEAFLMSFPRPIPGCPGIGSRKTDSIFDNRIRTSKTRSILGHKRWQVVIACDQGIGRIYTTLRGACFGTHLAFARPASAVRNRGAPPRKRPQRASAHPSTTGRSPPLTRTGPWGRPTDGQPSGGSSGVEHRHATSEAKGSKPFPRSSISPDRQRAVDATKIEERNHRNARADVVTGQREGRPSLAV